MEEPDYDDLIEDFMEDYEEEGPPPPPPTTNTSTFASSSTAAAVAADFYDDDFLAEMEEAAHGGRRGGGESTTNLDSNDEEIQEPTSPISTNLNDRLLAASATSNNNNNNNNSSSFATTSTTSPAAQIRSDFASNRSREGNSNYDVFSFERYKPTSSWRQDSNKNSPTTMRAREWKSKQQQQSILNGIGRYNRGRKDDNHNNKSNTDIVLATTPEAQVLQYLTTHNNTVGCSSSTTSTINRKKTIRISRRDQQMSSRPIEGQTNITMTLGDGNRVFVQQHEQEETITTRTTNSNNNSSQTSTYSLGISMSDLIRRVQAIQRKKEHDRLKKLSKEIRVQRRKLARSRETGSDREDDDDDDDNTMADDEDDDEHASNAGAGTSPPPDDQLWVDKHAPSTFANLLSDERTNREVLRSLREWDPYVFHRDPPPRPKFIRSKQQQENEENNNKKDNNDDDNKKSKNPRDRRPDEKNRVILLSGPPGVGKTTLAHIVAKHCGYRPMEINGSDERSASVLTERVIRSMESATLDMHTTFSSKIRTKNSQQDWKGRPNCLIVDEIDGADAKQALQALVEMIRQEMPVSKESGGKRRNDKPYLKRPIIFICNNLYSPALRPLLPFARRFQVEAPAPPRLVARLRAVLSSEGLSLWGGTTLLHDLVSSTGGDIRSCLYTLQFAATEVTQRQRKNNKQEDISKALISALNGNGMKDDRTDVAGTTMTVFRKTKKKGKNDRLWGTKQMSDPRTSVERVLEAVEGFGEHMKVLDCLYLNLLNVSYIDPTFDRCAAAFQWLSGADVRGVQQLYVPCAAAALHLLCRVEQKPDLTFTTRSITDANYQREANLGLLDKFSEGLSAHYRGSRSAHIMVKDTIPYALWMLSAGEGSSALSRPASSVEILNKGEQQSFQSHVETLRSLGLTYVAASNEFGGTEQVFSPNNQQGGQTVHMVLEPPIERLVQFDYLKRRPENRRNAIPSAMKELLARKAALQGIRERGKLEKSGTDDGHNEVKTANKSNKQSTPQTDMTETENKATLVTPQPEDEKNKRNEPSNEEIVKEVRPEKRQKVSAQNFLGLGAKKAKEAKWARRAKNVGFIRSRTIDKKSNTGSGVPFRQVIRLKYVKGFTQAVRNPCRLEDLR